MTKKEKIASLLKEIKPTINLTGVDDIIDSGYLDSLELMALISGIIDEFGVEIEVDNITPENFNSIDAMEKMIRELKK